MANQQDTAYDRLIQRFQIDVLDRIIAEVSNGRINDEGRVRTALRKDLQKIVVNNLEEPDQVKLLLHVGKEIYHAHEVPLARECFEAVITKLADAADSAENTQVKVEAIHGIIRCDHTDILSNPRFSIAPMAMSKLLNGLEMLRSSLTSLFELSISDQEKLAWLVLNGCKLIYSLGQPLLLIGCSKYVAETMIFASLTMDAVINLCTARHFQFKLKLVSTAFSAMLTYASMDECSASIAYIADKVSELREREELDPPVLDSTELTLKQAETDIAVMRTTLEFWKDPDSFDLTALKGPHEELECAGDRHSYAERCLMECARVQQLTAGNVNETWKKRSTCILRSFLAFTVPSTVPSDDDQVGTEDETAEAGGNATEPVVEKVNVPLSVCALVDVMTVAMFDSLDGVSAEEVLARIQLMIPDIADKSSQFSEFSGIDLDVLVALAEFKGNESPETASKLIKKLEDIIHSDHMYPRKSLIRKISLAMWSKSLYPALQDTLCRAEAGIGTDEIQFIVEPMLTVVRCLDVVSIEDPVLMGSVALITCHLIALTDDKRRCISLLHKALETLDNHRAARVDLSLHLPDDVRDVKALQHASFTCRSDNAPLWHQAAKRLGAHAFAGYGLFGTSSAMYPSDQAMADIHTDLLILLFRTELAYGISSRSLGLAFKASSSKKHKETSTNKLAGTTTVSGKSSHVKTSSVALHATSSTAATTAVLAPSDGKAAMERVDKLPCVTSLRSTWGKSTYGRCLLLLEMARVELIPEQRRTLLKEAVNCVTEAEDRETRMLSAFDELTIVTESTSRYPVVLARSHTFIYVAPVANKKVNYASAHHYRVFGREEGSGTDVSSSSDELSGCDKLISASNMHSPSAAAASICSLRLGERYVFASAGYDDDGKQLGAVSPTCMSVEAVNPLPTLLLWGHIATLADEYGYNDITKTAASKVCDHFIHQVYPQQKEVTFGKGINVFPIDQYFINTLAVQQSSPVQLCNFIKCFLLMETIQCIKNANDALIDTSAVEIASVKLHWNFKRSQQLSIVNSMNRLSLVTTIASYLQHHELILKCVCLGHSLVSQSLYYDMNQLAPALSNSLFVLISALQVTKRKNWRSLDHHLYCRLLLFSLKCAVICGNTTLMKPILENFYPDQTEEVSENEDNANENLNTTELNGDVLKEYGALLHCLQLKNGEMLTDDVLKQMHSVLGIPNPSADQPNDVDIWTIPDATRIHMARTEANGLLTFDSSGDVSGIHKQMLELPPRTSGFIDIVISCMEELRNNGSVDDVKKLLNKFPIRKSILASAVSDDCSKWELEFIRDISQSEDEENVEGETPQDNGDESSETKPKVNMEVYSNVDVLEIKAQFKGIARICTILADTGFSAQTKRNDYLDSNLGPFVRLSHRDLVEGISEYCLDLKRQDSADKDFTHNDDSQPTETSTAPTSPRSPEDPPYTQVDYVKHLSLAVVMFVRGECFQAALDSIHKLWTYILNKWYDPKTFAEEFFSVKNYVLTLAEAIVKIAEMQCASAVTNESFEGSMEFCHPHDVKESMYILKDPYVFIMKVLCLLKEDKIVVDYGSRMLEVYIYNAPEYAKVLCDGLMSYLIFSQEEIIRMASERVQERERRLEEFITAYEEAQAKKRKKKLRIARAEKSDEELKFEADKCAFQEKLNRANMVYESSCSRKDGLIRLSKRVDGIYTTGQQLFDKVRKSSLEFIAECRGALAQHPGDDFSTLLKSKNYHRKFDEIVDHFDQVAQFLREKKECVSLLTALHEQGDFLILFDQVDSARSVWRDAIDGLFNTLDAWKEWHDVTSVALRDLDDNITKSAIPALIVLGKLSRHCSNNDFDMKSNYCQMAARICRIPFMEGIGHPSNLNGFAAYCCVELGGKAALEFNSSLFTAFSFQSALEEIIRVLGYEGQELHALPVVVLLEHFNGYYTRRVDKFLEARLQRIRFLISLHMFAEASSMIACTLPTLRNVENGYFCDALKSAIAAEEGQEAFNTGVNGLEYLGKPPFFNHLPPEDEQNQKFLKWLADFPSQFSEASKTFTVDLPPLVKTEEELALEKARADAAATESAANKKGKKKQEEAAADPVDTPPRVRPLFSRYHIAEVYIVCAQFLMGIARLDRRLCVSHHAVLEDHMNVSQGLITAALQHLKVPEIPDEHEETKEPTDPLLLNPTEGPCSWANSTWVSLYRRCRVLHIEHLFLQRNFKASRTALLSLLQHLTCVSGVFGDAKYELTQLWLQAKLVLAQNAEYQARFTDVIKLAGQGAMEASQICSGYWVRAFLLQRAVVHLKIGNITESETDCRAVLKSFEDSKIICIDSVRAHIMLASVLHTMFLNSNLDNAIKLGSEALSHVRLAKNHAQDLCAERGFLGGDSNFTYSYTPSVVMKHDRFTPFHHNITKVYCNYPDMLSMSLSRPSDSARAERDEWGGDLYVNGFLRPAPVDTNDTYTTSPICTIYLREVRVLSVCYNSLCILLDELRLANICSSLSSEYGAELSPNVLLKEQLVAGEEGLKVLRYVVYPSSYIKSGLLLSVGKARAAESQQDTMAGLFPDCKLFLPPLLAGLEVCIAGPHHWDCMKALCLEIVECYGNQSLNIDDDHVLRLKNAVKYLSLASKLDNMKFNVDKKSLETGSSLTESCPEALCNLLTAVTSSSVYGSDKSSLPSSAASVDGTVPATKGKGKKTDSTPASKAGIPAARDALWMLSSLAREGNVFWQDGIEYELRYDLVNEVKNSFQSFGESHFIASLPNSEEELVVAESSLTSLWSPCSPVESDTKNSSKKGSRTCLFTHMTGYLLLGGIKNEEDGSDIAAVEPLLTKVITSHEALVGMELSFRRMKERIENVAKVSDGKRNGLLQSVSNDLCILLQDFFFLLRGGSCKQDQEALSLTPFVDDENQNVTLAISGSPVCSIPVEGDIIGQFATVVSHDKSCLNLMCDRSVALYFWAALKQ